MLSLAKPYQLLIAATLIALVVVTRGHHFASVQMLPSASWAVFFLAGVYLTSRLWLPVFIALAVGLDLIAVTWGGVAMDCISAAYGFMLVGYAVLWWGGRFYASHYEFHLRTLLPLVATVVVTAALANLFSGGSYYWLSGNYADPNWAEYGPRFLKYFPKYLANFGFYVAAAVVVHIAFYTSQLGQKSHQSH